MRISFMIIVLFAAGVFWKVVEHGASASPQEVIVRKVLPMDVPFERMEARTQLNSIREAMNMNTLMQNENLNSAAQAHADYLVLNNESSHYEIEGHTNFTGIKPFERAFYAGYNISHVSENLSTKHPNAKSSIDGLFSAIYHRFGFLSPSIDEIGVGVTQNEQESDKSAFVYLMGNSELNRLCSLKNFNGTGKYVYKVCKHSKHRIAEKKFYNALNYNKENNPKIIIYPYDGQEEVPPAFYSEVPDPLPDHEVSGFPISIEFNDYFFKELQVNSFKLFKKGEEEVINVRLMDKDSDPHQRFTQKQYALFPLERLEYDTQYSAEVEYVSKNRTKKLIWTFRTQIPTEKLHIVTEKAESLEIESGESHIIYFKPLDAHDIVKNIQFPTMVDIQFIDNNTLKLTLMSDDIDNFDIVSDTRVLHIDVKSSH